ncbi:coat protein [ssRNA phage Gerhypos.1_32]|jgi:hypothetical protein|uniref:Coat protein n=2 Tax=Fiersviridae TaxID=2842319 RepID=A0A8S5KZL9_9VIRU|nr:coat protein [ssRNA phage Gerhypos.1_32]QDH90707.1 MAG: hypothetical protein H1Bulk30157_000003 [Leviviridae sp.]DAD50525.1 TPA_asm: coat protein [ssRNA phage Gerhypos.1_32]
MAAQANVLVKDDANPVVEQTLIPITDTPIPFWRGTIAGVPLEGQPRLYLSSEKVKSGAYKQTLKLEVPVMETLGASGTSAGYVAPPKVAYVNTVIFTMFADARSTIADRANAIKMAIGIAQGASSTTATGVLNQATAADGFKSSTLPGPQFFTSLVIPN